MYPGLDYTNPFQTPGVSPEQLEAARANAAAAPQPPPAAFPGGVPQGGGYAQMVGPAGGPVRPTPGVGPQPMGSSTAAFAAANPQGQAAPVPFAWKTGGPAAAMNIPGAEIGTGGPAAGPAPGGAAPAQLGAKDALADQRRAAIAGMMQGNWQALVPYIRAKRKMEKESKGSVDDGKLPDPGY